MYYLQNNFYDLISGLFSMLVTYYLAGFTQPSSFFFFKWTAFKQSMSIPSQVFKKMCCHRWLKTAFLGGGGLSYMQLYNKTICKITVVYAQLSISTLLE